MAMYVRTDIFKKYDVLIPTTWDEYTTAAQKLHKANPKLTMTFFDPNNAEWFNGLLWQNNANMHSYSGDKARHRRVHQEQAGRRLLAEDDRRQAGAHRPGPTARRRCSPPTRTNQMATHARRAAWGYTGVPRQPAQPGGQVVHRPDADLGRRAAAPATRAARRSRS